MFAINIRAGVPSEMGLTVIVRIQNHLEHWKSSTSEVEEDVSDTPADGGFSSVVHHSLWHVFNQRDGELDVATSVEEVKPVPDPNNGDDERNHYHSEKDAYDAASDIRHSLVSALRVNFSEFSSSRDLLVIKLPHKQSIERSSKRWSPLHVSRTRRHSVQRDWDRGDVFGNIPPRCKLSNKAMSWKSRRASGPTSWAPKSQNSSRLQIFAWSCTKFEGRRRSTKRRSKPNRRSAKWELWQTNARW